MKNFSLIMFNVIALILIVVCAIFAVHPFKSVDMEQAKRIAKWKMQYDQFLYCFSLVNTHEGSIVKMDDFSEKKIISMISPYFNLENEDFLSYDKYRYKEKNGRRVLKNSQFYFDKFLKRKDGGFISFKINKDLSDISKQPLFYMFVDINGELKPNRIGKDIFFIDVFTHTIKALGYDKPYSSLKHNCSSLGSGLYCSEFYLLGGHV